MKRLLCLILTAATLICLLPGCAERVKEPVTFYYLRENPSRGLGPEIAGEIREGSGHRDNLRYLLAFYLMGPADKELTSPLPRGTVLYQLEQTEDEWVFGIHDGCADLTDIITTAFVLNMDSQLLCRPDCKGVCFRCGKNLNEGPCGCKKEPDSRFAVLQQLLDK